MQLGILSCFDANNMRDDNFDVINLINNLYNKEKVIISKSTDLNEIMFPIQIDMKNTIFKNVKTIVSPGEINRAQFVVSNENGITYSFKAERLTNQLLFFFEIDDNGNKKIYKNTINHALPFYIGLDKVSIPMMLCESDSVTEVIYLHFMPRVQIIKPPPSISENFTNLTPTENNNWLLFMIIFSLLYLLSK